MASLPSAPVFHSKLTAFVPLVFQLPGLSFTGSFTRRHSTTRLSQAPADVPKFLKVQPRSSDMEQFYGCNYHSQCFMLKLNSRRGMRLQGMPWGPAPRFDFSEISLCM